VNLFYFSDDIIPITATDSSGFASMYCCHYFSERTGKIRKHFLKTSISFDTERQVIAGLVASNSRVHDTRHAMKPLQQYQKCGDLIATLWTRDLILKRFTGFSVKTFIPIRLSLFNLGITKLSVVIGVKKWLVSSIIPSILESNS